MEAKIRVSETEAQPEAIYRLRDDIYVEKMNRYGSIADHENRPSGTGRCLEPAQFRRRGRGNRRHHAPDLGPEQPGMGNRRISVNAGQDQQPGDFALLDRTASAQAHYFSTHLYQNTRLLSRTLPCGIQRTEVVTF